MSRKTRKLMWSVPLIAAVAVIGVLAAFMTLAPDDAAAHEASMHGPPGPVTGLMAAVATGNDSDGQPAGRTQINLSWMVPDDSMGASATSYRIDYSDNTRVWRNLVGGESGEAALMDSMADDNCAADAAVGMRCYTDDSLKPGQMRHYRVFAMNYFGTSPVSIVPTYATAITVDYARPSAARGLTATTSLVDSIVLDWQPPTDLGGATLAWYCIAVGTTQADVPNLTDTGTAAIAQSCLDATEATEGDVDVGVQTIVVPADMTTYTQGGLDEPDIISQYYRVYAVTDRDGDPKTPNDATASPAVTGERWISLAASNIANGRTVSPLPDVNTDVEVTPDPVTNLRYVASRADGATDVTLSLYWTLPANYPPAPVGTVTDDNPDLRLRWRIEVERWNPSSGTSGAFEAVAGRAVTDGSTPAQWVSTEVAQTNTLNDAEQLFQVRYVNNVDGTNDTPDDGDATNDDDVYGTVDRFRVPRTTVENYEAQDLPRIADTVYTAGSEAGLRFRHNEVNPTIWLDLVWSADTPTDTTNNNPPTGYVIDYTEAATITQHTRWISLPNARRPSDLGATTQYTHKGVTPGKKYTYRVFPEFGSHNVIQYDYRYGLPAMEEASSRAAPLPDPVQGLRVVANPDKPQTELKLTWSMLADDPKGHPVMGYLVEVASDQDNDMSLAADATWTGLSIQADIGPPVVEAQPWSVDKDTLTYTYDGESDGSALTADDNLAGGYVRWFRVIAITAQNDGVGTTGGQAVNPADGTVASPPSSGETTPNTATQLSARPEKGMTDGPAAPSDPSQVTSPPMPEDLTSEEASDTNLLDPTDRGVLLLWNEPGEAEGINAYIVQRKIGTGDWTPIGRVTARTSFSDAREYVDGEDLQYRVGSLGASSVPATYTEPVTYPTHPATHGASTPQMVTATADSATEITVSWMPPAYPGVGTITGYTVKWKESSAMDYDAADMAMVAASASSYQVTGLMGDTSYDFQVIATNAHGGSDPSMVAIAMTESAVVELGAPTAVATCAAGDPGCPGLAAGSVQVTWTNGANALGHLVLLFDTSDWSLAAPAATQQDSGDTTFTGLSAGTYMAVVVSYDANDVQITLSPMVTVN